MHEYLPVLIVGAIIGAFTIVFLLAYWALRKVKDDSEKERNMPDGEIVRRLMRYAKPYWKSFVLVFFVMVFSIVYDLVSPLIIGRIQGLIKNDFELHQLYTMVGIYAGILVVSMVCTYLQAMILQKTGQKILSQIRLDVFTHIEKLSHEQLNNIPVGKLVTRVSNDPDAISYMFTNILVTLAKNSMVIVGVLG
ncbi:MAG: ABC transporter ATP-binding protein, partial [Lachnospiraceae bacterium]|nr:ABC transporter ATP-binding protein [Lachnospiraceae bacterium]